MARYGWFAIFEAIATSQTSELHNVAEGWHQDATALFLEVIGGATPDWVVTFQGKLHPASTYANVDYIQTGQAGTPPLRNTAITVSDTTSRIYLIPNPPPFIQIIATRTAGDLTMRAAFHGLPHSQWVPPPGLTVPSADQLAIGGITYTMKSTRTKVTANGNTLLIAAVAAKQIMIATWHVSVSANMIVTIQDAATTVLIGPLNFANNDHDGDPFPKVATERGAVNTAVNVNKSTGSGAATVHVRYVEV